MNELNSRQNNGSYVTSKRFWFYSAGAVLVLFLLLLAGSVIALRWVNPDFTSFTLREDWKSLETDRYSLREYWVPQDQLPDHLKWAVIASEDQQFNEHFGLDWSAIETAMDERRSGESSRGASTITQQVAKNIYLWPAPSWFRKIIEAGIAVLIEIFWTKDRIMEVYLNIAEFGPGLFGVGKAASDFFDKVPSELEPEESARLAAVLPEPKRMRVEPPSPFTKERSQWVLGQMTRITGIQYLPESPSDSLDPNLDEMDPFSRLMDPMKWDADVINRSADPMNWGIKLDIDLNRNFNYGFDEGTGLGSGVGSRFNDTIPKGDTLLRANGRQPDPINHPEKTIPDSVEKSVPGYFENAEWQEAELEVPDLSIDLDSLFPDTMNIGRDNP